MKDQSKTKQALIQEMASLRQRIEELEQTEPKRTPVEETVRSLMRLIDAAPDSITVHDFDGNFLYANQKTFELHGYTREGFFAATLHDIDVPESEELIASRMQQILETGEASFEVAHFRKDGSIFPLIVHARIGNWNEKKVIFSIASDITERKRKEDELQKISKLLAETQAITKVGGWEYDVATARIKWTDEVYRIYGVGRDYDPSNVNRAISFYAPEDAAVIERAFRQAMESGEPYDLVLGFIRANGERIWVRTIGRPFIEDGKVVRIAGNFMDITDRKRTEEALRESEQRYRELSIIDDLTQLYNSRHFYVQLKSETERSNRYEQPLTLLLLDLDNFKAFNDAYGHVEGDQVLSRLGQVVKRCLRETDSAYRYGGEEFTILLPMTTSEDGTVTAERIRTEFKKESFSPMSGQDVHMTVSIGLAQYRTKEEMKAFVHRVDQWMYQGKKGGKDRICCESQPQEQFEWKSSPPF